MDGKQHQSELTKALLLSISYHLSRNRDTSSQEYIVAIGMTDSRVPSSMSYTLLQLNGTPIEDCVFLDTVARNCRHTGGHRTNILVPSIQHIIFDHFGAISKGLASKSICAVYGETLEPGVYQYKRSVSGKSRKWFKVG